MQYSTYIDREGNLWMEAGTVQCFHASDTVVFHVGGGGRVKLPRLGSAGDSFRPVPGNGASLQGGSGRNLNAAFSGYTATLAPEGCFVPTGENQWSGPNGSTATFVPGDGSGDLKDSSGNALATLAPGGSTIAPYGTFVSTPYGEGLNGSVPFTVDVSYEGAATAWPDVTIQLNPYAGTAGVITMARTGWQTWAGSGWSATLDAEGAGVASDGIGTVLVRAADNTKLHDPSGIWVAEFHGRATYNGGEEWAADVVTLAAYPIAGHLWVELTVDGSNEVTSVAGPFFGAAYTSPSPTLRVVRIAQSDGAGGVIQIQEGPIFWES